VVNYRAKRKSKEIVMSYIVIKTIKGNKYRYQVRSERRGGKVVQVFEKYLGPVVPKNSSKIVL